MAQRFANFASSMATLAGSYVVFLLALSIVIVWAISGPLFGFSDTWQLVINTGTTVVTFLMVFLIQNTQHRDTLALHIKLDEIIRSIERADDEIMEAEDATEQELAEFKAHYREIAERNRALRAKVGPATAMPDCAPREPQR